MTVQIIVSLQKAGAANKGSGQAYGSSKDPLRKPAHGNVSLVGISVLDVFFYL